MMTNERDRGWHIDPVTLRLTRSQPAMSEYVPTCPVCSTDVEVEHVDVTSWSSPDVERSIPMSWRCPNECDPRAATPG